ncbi:MAG TPA: hydrogenase maturation protease [Symbiobacteriaceae bacterium]
MAGPTRIIGLGNPLWTDEGVGYHVLEALRQVELPPDVELVDGGTGGLNLLVPMTGAARIIFVDAVRSGHPPGTLFRLPESALAGSPVQVKLSHAMGLDEVIRIYREVEGGTAEILIYCVEAADVSTFGMELTPAVRAAVPSVVRHILADLSKAPGTWGSDCPAMT